MKPGTKVAFVDPAFDTRVVPLGRLVQPVIVDDHREWSVEWLDGFRDPAGATYREDCLLRVVPQ